MKRRDNLFFIELVLNLFLFSVSAAVCVGLLIHARTMSLRSAELTQAVYLAQSIAEDWKGDGVLSRGDLPGGDGLRSSVEEKDGLLNVSIWKDDTLVYSIEGVSRLG